MWSSDEDNDQNSEDEAPAQTDSLYGVFAEDETDPGRKRGRRNNILNENKKSRIMSFVAAPNPDITVKSSKNNDIIQSENEHVENEHLEVFRKTMGIALGHSHKKNYENEVINKPKRSRPVEKPGWEKHTKGFGMKMLLKHGYQGGGLGKEGKGISRHVEVAGPRGTEGLGAVQESTNLKANKLIQKQLTGKDTNSDEEEDAPNRHHLSNIAERTAQGNLWRKDSSHDKKKKKHGSEYSLNKEIFTTIKNKPVEGVEDHGPKVGSLVVDMRAPETRIISSTTGTTMTEKKEDDRSKQVGMELLHNLNLHVRLAEGAAQDIESQLQSQSEQQVQLQGEVKELSKRVEESNEQYDRFLEVESLLMKLTSTVDGNALPSIIDVFQQLRSNKFAQEYMLFDLGLLTQSLVTPLLEHQLKEWNPLEDPYLAIDLLEEWKPLLDPKSKETLPSNHTATHFDSAEVIVMRKVRSFINSNWDVTFPDRCVRLVEAIITCSLISHVALEECLTLVILPKLKTAIEDWGSGKHNLVPAISRVDLWVQPWLPYLQNEVESLFPLLRRKLVGFVDSDFDERHGAILKSFLTLFDSKTTEQLVVQIGIKLSTRLKKLKIDPSNQSLQVIDPVMEWCSLLPLAHRRCLLRGEFFPIWYSVLYEWLFHSEANANSDIVRWYQGWKSYLCKSELLENEIQGDLGFALDLMKVCRDRQSKGMELPQHQAFRSSYMLLLKEESVKNEQEKANAASSNQSSHFTYQSQCPSSFKDVVSAYAESKGIEFYIKNGRQYQGRQLYSFGSLSIYLDSDVVHADQHRNGLFVPIGLEELSDLS